MSREQVEGLIGGLIIGFAIGYFVVHLAVTQLCGG